MRGVPSPNPGPGIQDLARFSRSDLFQAEPRKMLWRCDEIVTFVPSSRAELTKLFRNLAACHRTWKVMFCDEKVTWLSFRQFRHRDTLKTRSGFWEYFGYVGTTLMSHGFVLRTRWPYAPKGKLVDNVERWAERTIWTSSLCCVQSPLFCVLRRRMSRFKTSIVSTVAEGDKTTFVWRVGQVRNVRQVGSCTAAAVQSNNFPVLDVLIVNSTPACCTYSSPQYLTVHCLYAIYSFGECVKSPVVRVGEKSFWQARYFPKVSPCHLPSLNTLLWLRLITIERWLLNTGVCCLCHVDWLQGFADPDYASIYVTSIDCELKVCAYYTCLHLSAPARRNSSTPKCQQLFIDFAVE